MTVNVGEASSWGSLKNVLEIGFAILISLLVILGLVVAFKKLSNREEEGPEPLMDESQSYTEILRKLNLSTSGTSQQTLKSRITIDKLDITKLDINRKNYTLSDA